MSGEVILGIVTAVCTMIVTVVTVIVRSDVNALKAQVVFLTQVVSSSHSLILSQNAQIQSLTAQKVVLLEEKAKSDDTKEFSPSGIARHMHTRPDDF